MGGFIAPSTTIGGSVQAPGIPFTGSPLSGLFSLNNGLGLSISQTSMYFWSALGFQFGPNNTPTPSLSSIANYATSNINHLAPVITPNGYFLYHPNAAVGTVDGFSVNTNTGALTRLPGSPFACANDPFGSVVHPNGQFLFVSDGNSQIFVYSINPLTGSLTNVAGSPFAVGGAIAPSGIALKPSGDFLFVACAGTTQIKTFSVNSTTGALALTATTNVAVAALLQYVLTVGNFLYVKSTGASEIFGYIISNTGVLTPIAGSPFVTLSNSFITIDTTKNYAICNGQIFSINQTTGALTALSQTAPTGVLTFDATNNLAYNNSGVNDQVFRYDPNTLIFTLVSSIPAVSANLASLLHPTGNFLYYGGPNAADIGAVKTNTLVPPLVTGTFDPTGGGGGAFNINGGLAINGSPVVSGAITAIFSVPMVANAGSATITNTGINVLEVTGALAATGIVTLTMPVNPTTVIVDNSTTGGFPLGLTIGATTYYTPFGRVHWYWNGTTLEQVNNASPVTLAKSAVAVPAPADLTEDILVTINMQPLKANDFVKIYTLWSVTNNANAKTLRVRLGGIAGAAYENVNAASNASAYFVTEFANRNATNSQVGPSGTAYGLFTTAVITSAVDTSVPFQIVITSQKAVAGDTIQLEHWRIEVSSNGT